MKIECEKNRRIVRCNDRLMIKTLHVIMEILKLIIHITAEILLSSFDNKYILYYITK